MSACSDAFTSRRAASRLARYVMTTSASAAAHSV